MKTKAPNSRQFDKDGYKLRAGCLCFKDTSKKEDDVIIVPFRGLLCSIVLFFNAIFLFILRVLLVSSSSRPDRWVVPAGCVEFGETNQFAAVRETREEAYVSGYVDDFIGVFQNDSIKTKTAIYSFIVTEEHTPRESIHNEIKSRQWFTLNDAIQALCHKPVQQSYLLKICSPTTVVNHLNATLTLSSQRPQTSTTSVTPQRTLVRIVQ